jgi:hypothetical protein
MESQIEHGDQRHTLVTRPTIIKGTRLNHCVKKQEKKHMTQFFNLKETNRIVLNAKICCAIILKIQNTGRRNFFAPFELNF